MRVPADLADVPDLQDLPDRQRGDARPDPDALLRRVQAEQQREARAHLKIFFGYAPGVGKTYAMLAAAKRAQAEGVDVAVASLETHGRSETAAMTQGLEHIAPRTSTTSSGAILSELDSDAALRRRPALLLVDELAHSNAPGGRHQKRWQDVLEFLDAGIDVWTTLNVQHVESLHDPVAQVTQVLVRETVPDAVLDRADEIVLVDLPPDELLVRLKQGRVYLGDQAARAAQHFFRRGNLLALRELALRRTAARVDDDIRAFRDEHDVRGPWAFRRLLVAVGPGPSSARVVRAARRLADELDAPWVAVTVDSPLTPLSEVDRSRLEEHLKLAERLGARVARLTGTDVADTLLDYARSEDVAHIVIGRAEPTSLRARARALLRGTWTERVVAGAAELDVHVVGGRPLLSGAEQPAREKTPLRRRDVVLPVLVTAVATGVGIVVDRFALGAADVVMLYLVGIMAVAVAAGRFASVLAAALSVAAFDFFFIEPRFTFAVNDRQNLLSFAMMFGVGLFISSLTLRLKREQESARLRERRTDSVLALTRALSDANDADGAARALCQHAAEAFQREAAVLLPDDVHADAGTGEGGRGALNVRAAVGVGAFDAREQGVVQWVFEHGRDAGRGTDSLRAASVLALPLLAGSSCVGVLALLVRQADDDAVLDADQRELAQTFSRQAAVALERLRLTAAAERTALQQALQGALERRTEEVRSALLSAVSHDLRTPLASITGAATMLVDDDSAASLSKEDRRALLTGMAEQGFHLERLVGSLLDMTRVEAGALVLRCEWVPVDELIGAALSRVEPRLLPRRVHSAVDADTPLFYVDVVLFEQVLVNLLENAAQHTPADTTVHIAAGARRHGDAPHGDGARGVFLRVDDDGPGLPALPPGVDVFERFVRGPHSAGKSGGGVGLGLSLCRGIVEAHGGTLRAEPRQPRGVSFLVSLPPPPPPPVAPEAS